MGRNLAIVRTVPWDKVRSTWALEVAEQVGPPAIVVHDEHRSGYETYLDALRVQVQHGVGAWHLEDDIILTSGWREKAEKAARDHGDTIITGFSNRRRDLDGSHYESGGSFCMNQCYWVPAPHAQPLIDFSLRWEGRLNSYGDLRRDTHYDWAMGDYMRSIKMRYWVVVPSIVQHRHAPSLLGHSNNPNRFSRTFQP